ncbi:MAG: AglZ/HisF2 family acetamidino modification protein [Chloroflexota bacterium]|nr:AglZ/HisF2 family acetamidino modification protein [Chloroflexota bacterium]
MLKARVIPSLLIKSGKLVKTTQFKDAIYIGDPVNAARIFNQKQVPELILLDINATKDNHPIFIDIVSRVSDECFMPLTSGGGIKTIEDIRQLLNSGAEKVSINTQAVENPSLIAEASSTFGSQSIVVSIDVKKTRQGRYEVYTHDGTKKTGIDPVALAIKMEEMGAGEILLNSIDRDGTRQGYDIELVKKVSDSVGIPLIASGGAGSIEDFSTVIHKGHASAATAGSLFVFHGKRLAVLISFPTKEELESSLSKV